MKKGGSSKLALARGSPTDRVSCSQHITEKGLTLSSVSESYITHIRIEEDSAFPSTPPPRESGPDKKKARVIIVAVRKSGRVRMHKAKENANSTFSIGKTWVLDDLTVIESFTNAVPQTPEQHQDKQRAGPTGFIITVQKPYFWNAHTAKEKDFFIFSLIKIFKKYTGGRLPQLLGFSSAELEQLGGSADTPNGTPSSSQPGLTAGPNSRKSSQDPPSRREPLSPGPTSETNRERRPRPSQERSSQERPTHRRPSHERPPQQRPSQERPPPERQLHSAAAHPLRTARSNDRIHMPGSFPSSDSVNDPSQQPQLRTKRSESPAVLQQPTFRRPGPNQSSDSFRSGQESFESTLLESTRSSNERPRVNGSYSSSNLAVNAAEDRPSNAAKDTRGPSPLSQEHGLSEPPAISKFVPRLPERHPDQAAPLPVEDARNGHRRDRSASSKGSSREGRGPPSLGLTESGGDLVANGPRPTTISDHDAQPQKTNPQEPSVSVENPKNRETAEPQSPSVPTPVASPPEQSNEEVHRPGLGPMIKSKKSSTEVASKFRRAATAYNAFKPRPGGAAEKLKDEKSTGGDGITGVFQAPSLLKALSQEDTRPATPKENTDVRPPTPEVKKENLLVNVTISPPTTVVTTPAEQPKVDAEIQNPPPIPEKALEERRKKRQSDHSAKYAKSLGISPSLLEGRTFEMESVLNDFGWGEERNQKSTFDDLEAGIRKELARVEAGSWLGAVENNDDRAVAVGNMMDRVIAECEELDCLLTLYNVELGVKFHIPLSENITNLIADIE